MNKDKFETISNLFECNKIRSAWDSEKGEYYFSIVDIIKILTGSSKPSHYWKTLKSKMIEEGNETVTNCKTFKLETKNGKIQNVDMFNMKGILRIIESIPYSQAESLKIQLAAFGSERIDEIVNPEIAIKRGIDYYLKKGYSYAWIESRLKGILNRNGV